MQMICHDTDFRIKQSSLVIIVMLCWQFAQMPTKHDDRIKLTLIVCKDVFLLEEANIQIHSFQSNPFHLKSKVIPHSSRVNNTALIFNACPRSCHRTLFHNLAFTQNSVFFFNVPGTSFMNLWINWTICFIKWFTVSMCPKHQAGSNCWSKLCRLNAAQKWIMTPFTKRLQSFHECVIY